MFAFLLPLVELLALVSRGISALRVFFASSRFGAWLMAGMATQAGFMVVKAMKFLGVAFVASKFAAPALIDYVLQPLTGLPDDWKAFLYMTKADEAAAVMLTALAMRASDKISLRKRQDAIWKPL